MIGYIESFLIILLEILCCDIFYGIFGEVRRERSSCRELFLIVILSSVTFLSSMFCSNYMIIKITMSILEIAMIMYAFMKISFIKSLI